MPATSRRLVRALLCLTVVIIVVAVGIGIHGIWNQTRRDLKDDLLTVLSTTQNALNIWAKETQEQVLFWANVSSTKRNVKALVRQSRSAKQGALHSELLASSAQRNLSAEMSTTTEANGYLGYFVMSLSGQVLSASHSELIGKNVRSFITPATHTVDAQSVVEVIKPGLREPIIIPPFRQNGELLPQRAVISIALAPVLSNGKAIAFLGFLLDPAESLTATTQLGRMGSTGETYAFDQAGYLVTESRFEASLLKAGLISPGQSAILSVQVRDPEVNLVEGEKAKVARNHQSFTKMAESAIRHQAGFDLDGYRDYRGVWVVGAWLWDSTLHLGLVTEIDRDEAYHSFVITRALVFGMLGLTVLAALILESGLWLRSRELERAVTSLERTGQKLQESIQARNEFISIAAHELRTPLTSLRLQINLIHKLADSGEICSYPKEKLAKITSVSSMEIERFSKIIRNLLEMSQIGGEGVRLEPQEFDLMRKIHDLHFQYSQQLERNGCTLTVSGPESVTVDWDRSQIEQVLTNLLSNAIKYGKGKPIEVAVCDEGSWVEVSVTDHGVGIKEEDQSKVFDKFERAGAINPEGGLGLGLYLVRKIVQTHRGTVSVKSTPGLGSTFTFKMPKSFMESDVRRLNAA